VAVAAFHLLPDRARSVVPLRACGPWRGLAVGRPLAALLAIWVGVQLLLPLRHFAIPGNTQWTEEGSRFAWHMLLHNKSGTARFRISGTDIPFDVPAHLTDFQMTKVVAYPELLLQFAHYIEDYYRKLGEPDVAVTVDTSVSLNGRPPQPLVDPTVDLTRIPRPYLPPAGWIVPLRPYR
jgi:hypothetical protein